MKLEIETWIWNMKLKMKSKLEIETWYWKLKLKLEIETWNWKLKLNPEIESWNWNLKLKLEIETWNRKFKMKLEIETWILGAYSFKLSTLVLEVKPYLSLFKSANFGPLLTFLDPAVASCLKTVAGPNHIE